MADETEFVKPDEMSPDDWAVFDRTGLPPRREESNAEVVEALRAAGWPVGPAPDPIEEAEAERERLEGMSPEDHLADIQEGRWQPAKR